MKDMLFRRMARGCFLLVTFLFLLPGCKQSDSWEEPVAEYFDKYTNTAAIEKHEISCGYEKDAGGTSCISSYGNKTVSFYLRNPRNYNLLTSFSTLGSGVIVSQSTSDKSVIYVTYPETYLIANDCGGSIGGTISLQEEETLREFESYTFSLKCNTPPPSVKGPMVNAAGGKYIVCFYMPTTELGSQRHSASSHKLFINNALVSEGSPSELMAASASRPSNLEALQGGSRFSATTPSGCTAFYYETGVNMQGGILSWSIRIEDGEGLSSKTMKASSDVRDVNLTLTGGEVFAQGDASQTFTASTDEGEVLEWSWSSSDESVVTVSGTNNGNSTSGTVDIVGGGTATVTVQAELSDGRILTRQKEVRVLGISFNETQSDFLKGQTDTSLSASLAGFPDGQTCTWTSSNSSVASINSSSGALSLSAKGKSTITVSATYGGRTVSKTKEIVVHEVKINGASEVFTGFGNTLSLTAAVDSPSGASAPTGIGYEWSSSAPGKATVSNGRVTPVASGSTNVVLTATLNGKSVTVLKPVTVYSLSLAGNCLLSKTGGAKSITATITPPPASGTFTYSWSSSSTNIATVSGSSTTGSVTPKIGGSSVITFSVKKGGSVIASATKTVYVIEIKGITGFLVGDSPRALSVVPATGPTYRWFSSNAEKASVYNTTGKITPKAAGDCNITCQVTMGSDSLDIVTAIKIANITFTGITNESAGITIAVGEKFVYPFAFPYDAFNGYIVEEESEDSSIATADTTSNSSSWYLHIEGKAVGETDVSLVLRKNGISGSAKKTLHVNVIAAHTVAFSNLSTYLASLPSGADRDHPYKLNITGLSASDVYNNGSESTNLNNALKAAGRFIDLSATTLPSGLTLLQNAFAGNSYLVGAPSIPSGVTNMGGCFNGCSNLKIPPASIANTVTGMASCFWDCYRLETAPALPSSVELIGGCFGGCSSLTSAPVIPASVTSMVNIFKGCSSLSGTVTVNALITDSEKWKDSFNGCTSLTSVVVKSSNVRNAILAADGNSAVSSKIVVTP